MLESRRKILKAIGAVLGTGAASVCAGTESFAAPKVIVCNCIRDMDKNDHLVEQWLTQDGVFIKTKNSKTGEFKMYCFERPDRTPAYLQSLRRNAIRGKRADIDHLISEIDEEKMGKQWYLNWSKDTSDSERNRKWAYRGFCFSRRRISRLQSKLRTSRKELKVLLCKQDDTLEGVTNG